MNAEETYVRLNQLIQEAEEAIQSGTAQNVLRWTGKAYATLIESGLGLGMQAATVKAAIGNHHLSGDYSTYTQVLGALFQAVAVAEIKSPVSAQGSFIPVGNSFDALAAVGRVLGQANKSVRIVDPYMDEKALTDFGILANEEISIELLADPFSVKASLAPAVRRWKEQYRVSRPLEARLSPSRALHDRLLIVDQTQVFTLTQSLRDFATRSPASILRVDTETALLKVQAYEAFWLQATPMV